jgi:hypothetical protein
MVNRPKSWITSEKSLRHETQLTHLEDLTRLKRDRCPEIVTPPGVEETNDSALVMCLSDLTHFLPLEAKKMIVQFLLFVITVLLLSIFWELTKMNYRLKTLLTQNKQDHQWARKDAA